MPGVSNNLATKEAARKSDHALAAPKTNFTASSGLQRLYSKMKHSELEAEAVANIAYDGLLRGKRVIYPDKSIVWKVRLMTLLFADWMTDGQYKRRKAVLDS